MGKILPGFDPDCNFTVWPDFLSKTAKNSVYERRQRRGHLVDFMGKPEVHQRYYLCVYRPSINPNVKAGGTSKPVFIVANLDYIQAKLSVDPYEVWLKKKPGATSNEVYTDLKNKNIAVSYSRDTTEQIIKMKNDPLLRGTNGALTLGFIVTIINTAIKGVAIQ